MPQSPRTPAQQPVTRHPYSSPAPRSWLIHPSTDPRPLTRRPASTRGFFLRLSEHAGAAGYSPLFPPCVGPGGQQAPRSGGAGVAAPGSGRWRLAVLCSAQAAPASVLASGAALGGGHVRTCLL